MRIQDAVDVTGDGAAHTLSSLLGVTRAKWFQVDALSIASTAIRIGGSSISATRGIPVGPGGAQFAPPVAELSNFYHLDEIYYLIQVGDTAAFSCGL